MVFYNSFIYPLILLMEAVLEKSYSLSGSYGLSILMLSAVVNVLILPFYGLAESWQKQERSILLKIQDRKNDIKAVFKGDEQYFYLRTLYRQNGYNSLMAVRSSFGLLIQIPFFIAAYQFLSHFSPLSGKSFLFLTDLAKPDHLFGPVNIMPLLMTSVNLLSAWFYVKGQSKRDKIQLYSMAALFLILLFNAASGLLLYWTCNNFISLIKNSFSGDSLIRLAGKVNKISALVLKRVKIPLLFLLAIMAFSFFTVVLYFISKSAMSDLLVRIAYFPTLYVTIIACLYYISRYKSHFFNHISVMIFTLLCLVVFRDLITNPFDKNLKDLFLHLYALIAVSLAFPLLEEINIFINEKALISAGQQKKILYLSIMTVVMLAGLAIPTSLVSSAPGDISYSVSLNILILSWSFLWLGILPLFLYFAGPVTYRKPLVVVLMIMAILAVSNFLLFPGSYGIITDSLQFEVGHARDAKMDVVFNLAVLGFIGLFICFLVYIKRIHWLQNLLALLVVALIGLTVINTVKIMDAGTMKSSNKIVNTVPEPQIGFSKDDKNTVILFLDRALASAVPIALEEKPELYEDYQGFTWYKNTLSFGTCTVLTLPSLLGGYDYSPEGMRTRPDLSLKEKSVESWTVLPEIFMNLDHSVSLYDPKYHDFTLPSESEIAPLESLKVNIKDLTDLYTKHWLEENDIPSDFNKILLRDKSFFAFSLFRMAPMFFREMIYGSGTWHSIQASEEELDKLSNMHNARDFLKYWSSLDYLSRLSHSDAHTPTFTYIGNDSTHEVYGIDSEFNPSIAKIDYPEEDIKKYGSVMSAAHMYTDVAVLKKITDWLEWMKTEGIYDNTQIIIVADHGRAGDNIYTPFFDPVHSDPSKPDYNGYHPLLMFKPFDAEGELVISDEFMTNADVPSMVLEPFGQFQNPHTAVTIDSSAKEKPLLVGDGAPEIYKHHKNEFLFSSSFLVKDSMLDPGNWSPVK